MKTKKILGILLACVMLLGLLPLSVFAAEGDQDTPINANSKWFQGTSCWLLNPTLKAGDTDGIWYTFTAEKAGILLLEHSPKTAGFAYNATMWVNGVEYQGYDDNGICNRPIATYPLKTGDVATINICAIDGAADTVYANLLMTSGGNDMTQRIKVKSESFKVYIGAGKTVYYQDDSTQAIYAGKPVTLTGDVENVEVIAIKERVSDTDGDGVIEVANIGGSTSGNTVAKPDWGISNNSDKDLCLTLSVAASGTHECVYDDDADVDCNTCGAVREIATACQHAYAYDCSKVCSLCGEETRPEADHSYDDDADADCNACGEVRYIAYPVVTFSGNSVSAEVNGLAFKFDVNVKGMSTVNNTEAVYDSATITPDSQSGACKLLGMGAYVYNGSMETPLQIHAKYLFSLDAAADAATFAVRVINIPDPCKDEAVYAYSYLLYEDADGNEQEMHGEVQTASYNDVLNG